ncbi:MAG TPA: hypothetical protein VK040_05955 [Balneolaceae bacterium]|nr:hypothetical protein [Balneolaceae bacterium]
MSSAQAGEVKRVGKQSRGTGKRGGSSGQNSIEPAGKKLLQNGDSSENSTLSS